MTALKTVAEARDLARALVKEAREKADAGAHAEALLILYKVAAVMRGTWVVDASMRWWETVGVLERAIGEKAVREYFAARRP